MTLGAGTVTPYPWRGGARMAGQGDAGGGRRAAVRARDGPAGGAPGGYGLGDALGWARRRRSGGDELRRRSGGAGVHVPLWRGRGSWWPGGV